MAASICRNLAYSLAELRRGGRGEAARLLLECLLGPDTVTATEAELVLGAGLGLDTPQHRAQPGQAGTEGAQHIRILNITKIIVKHIALVRWVL